MLDQTRGSDYTIWLVALLLYVCDAARLLSPRQLLVVEDGRGRLASAIAESPFTLMGRVLAFAPLFRPDRGAFVAPWGRPWLDRAALEGVTRSVDRLRASLLAPRVLASWGFVLIFGVGPLLTLLVGPNAAVAYTATLLYPTILAAIFWLWWRRRGLSLTAVQTLWLSVEILICPAFLPNLVRKVTLKHPIEADGAQLLVATASAEVKEEALTRLAARAEALIEEANPESEEEEQLRSYLIMIRGPR